MCVERASGVSLGRKIFCITSALAAFRQWFHNEYLPTKFPKYILTKANVLKGGKDEALAISQLFKAKSIGHE
ncbi:hypothetical protein BK651_00395 [Pseudomonas rhodesiae]|nr:hypothetical protein BK650_05645 [Pseudomonas rhodesiae]ROM67583.1 hypothetical protein BK651_00395 [Pseudomonas rhodesiae]